jgi:hypothetical protein
VRPRAGDVTPQSSTTLDQCEALSSNPSTTKKNKKAKWKVPRGVALRRDLMQFLKSKLLQKRARLALPALWLPV